MNVKVFSTQSCPWCHRVKDYLSAKGVEFSDVDVSQDRAAATEMIQKSGQRGVPVVDIGGEIVVGFNQAEIDKLLNL